jgi:DHA2 family multidrug resistance protein
MSPVDRSFLDFRLLRNANYVTGSVFIFVVSMVLFGSRALTPTMLESLLNYPVATTGLVIAPSGFGTMATMMIAGRIMGRVDLRLILFAGLVFTAIPLWQMTHYSLDLSQPDVVWPSLLQGMGIGLVFVPLSAATFATLTPGMRAQGTSIYSLVRTTVAAHAALAEKLTPANPAWANPAIASAFDPGIPARAAALDAAVTQQSAMIAYIGDFRLMLYLTLAMMPFLLIVRVARGGAAPAPQAAME